MSTKKLESWANKLLDVGKRNNLVNFKDSKSMTVEIVYPDVETIFAKAESSASFEIYDPKLSEDEDLDEISTEEAVAPTSDEASQSESEDKRQNYINTYVPKIKKQSMALVYNEFSGSKTAVKKIDKRAKSAIEETGVNVAYMAFGFIHWKESENSSIVYNAPVLLTPVSFNNESAISPYYIKMSEDDVVVNPTFNYMLNAQYGINLPEYSEGTLEAYLTTVKDMVAKLGWEVTSECKIGIFSFLKLNMYEDLKTNADKILNNNIIKSILGEKPAEFQSLEPDEEHQFKGDEIVDLHTVVDADSSQLEAIKMVKEGKSFVLQGPPGTGKSQTITNIISECLSDGKKVLFVSEKQAALNVVYDKLKKAGLDEFCLEIHSHKANKKAVVDDLCNTLLAPRSDVSSKANAQIEQKVKAQKELDRYAKELHKTRDIIEMSLYQLIEAYSANRRGADVEFVIKDILHKGNKYIHDQKEILDEYVGYIPSIGYQYKNNPWYGCIVNDLSYENTAGMKKDIETVNVLMNQLLSAGKMVDQSYGIEYSSLDLINTWNSVFTSLSGSNFITPYMLQKDRFEAIYPQIIKLGELNTKKSDNLNYLNAKYDADIFGRDGINLYKKISRQYTGFFSRLFSSEYKSIVSDLRLIKKNGKKPSYKELTLDMENLSSYQECSALITGLEATVSPNVGSDYQGMNTKWTTVIPDINKVKKIYDSGYDFGNMAEYSIGEYEDIKADILSIAEANGNLITQNSAVLDKVSGYFDKKALDMNSNPISKICNKTAQCIDNFDKISNWGAFRTLYRKLEFNDLDEFVDICIANNVAPELITDTFCKIFYRQWIENITNDSQAVFASFNRLVHDQSVELFKEKDAVQFEISKAQIKAELSKKRPSTDYVSQGSELAILLREGQKKRKLKSIRKLLEETGNVVQEIKPCFLMSPLSVSTFLGNSSIHFDTVVFDEASQIFPQDAVGAIYRGDQLIVVGDTKQMPPTNFFTATVETETEDDDIEDINDFESILDICSATMPQLTLKWHYRSRSEQLIYFSNRNFYNSNLVTFPGTADNKQGVGIDYFYVGGTFDHKSRRNMKEAESVVDLIFENIERFPDRSLGVVAFSISQQDAIERLLAKRRQADPSKEDFFSADRKEPFFIKNLETVQGDERDTIIFSTAYGPDATGRFIQNFGPLNIAGGERRLNVAITRAKINVQIITSMHHSDINIKDSQSEGKRLLKEYLDYAENGVIALERAVSVNEFEQYDSEFELEVCEFLRSKGYDVDTQVGVSNFRIDLGLKRPNSSDYVLAIECDGATYHSSRNARDRDRLRQEILERMGWKFYRIWSTDWFKNTAVEKERLLEAVKKALNCPVSDLVDHEHEDVLTAEDFESEAEEIHYEFPVYESVDDDAVIRNARGIVLEAIAQIAAVEAPVSEEWLLRRLVSMFGRSKVTNVVRDQYNTMTYRLSAYNLVRRNGFIYQAGNNEYVMRVPNDEFKRDVSLIAPEELAVGMRFFIEQNISVEREGLYTSMARALEFQRVGEAMYEKFDEALSLLSNVVVIEGEKISLK